MTGIFEAVFERSPVALLVVDASGGIVHLNQHAEELFGYDRSELLGQSIETLVPEAQRGRHPRLVQDYVAAPTPRQMGKGRTLFGVRKDQTQVPVEVGLNPIERDGEVLVLAAVLDLTDRILAEERFRAAVDAAPNGMLMIHSSGKIVLCNRQIEEIFGYSRDELIGEPIELLVPEEIRGPHVDFVASYLRNPTRRAMGAGRELHGRHRRGALIPVEIGLQPIVNGGETFVISSVVDITTRRDAELEIERKTREIEEFAYRTSHDLRSPLKSIAAMMECIEEDIDDGNLGEAKDGTRRVGFLTAKLLTLTQDLLTLTQIDAQSEPRLEFDFPDYVKTARIKFDEALTSSRTELLVDFGHGSRLETQPARLTQALDNLVDNAIKYGDPNKSARRVSIRTYIQGREFVIEVEDNGRGIPKKQHDAVFEMFKRFHSSTIPGSGLGLYIVKKQVAQLAGAISFDSDPGGTTFRVRLPQTS